MSLSRSSASRRHQFPGLCSYTSTSTTTPRQEAMPRYSWLIWKSAVREIFVCDKLFRNRLNVGIVCNTIRINPAISERTEMNDGRRINQKSLKYADTRRCDESVKGCVFFAIRPSGICENCIPPRVYPKKTERKESKSTLPPPENGTHEY